jgi:predicted HicB family RNase H-like nuclease
MKMSAKKTLIGVSPELHRKLKVAAAQRGVALNFYVEALLKAAMTSADSKLPKEAIKA